jgi:tetratricopeptide (TPR) repeat protein
VPEFLKQLGATLRGQRQIMFRDHYIQENLTYNSEQVRIRNSIAIDNTRERLIAAQRQSDHKSATKQHLLLANAFLLFSRTEEALTEINNAFESMSKIFEKDHKIYTYIADRLQLFKFWCNAPDPRERTESNELLLALDSHPDVDERLLELGQTLSAYTGEPNMFSDSEEDQVQKLAMKAEMFAKVGLFAKAIYILETALEIATRIGPELDILRGGLLKSIATVYHNYGLFPEAVKRHRQSIRLLETVGSTSTPVASGMTRNLGETRQVEKLLNHGLGMRNMDYAVMHNALLYRLTLEHLMSEAMSVGYRKIGREGSQTHVLISERR